jgi:hypothetical protein
MALPRGYALNLVHATVRRTPAVMKTRDPIDSTVKPRYGHQEGAGRATILKSEGGLAQLSGYMLGNLRLVRQWDVVPATSTPRSIAHSDYENAWTVWRGNSGRG